MKFSDTSVNHHFKVALLEPEIPQNTGNIGRTCVGTQSELHLIGQLGYELSDRTLKRAGLDYWQYLTWKRHESLQSWKQEVRDPKRVFYFSTKAQKSFFDQKFEPGDWFVFGRETKGLPEDLLHSNMDQVLGIPQFGPVRSLNLATAVAIVLYEAIRQQHY